MRSSEWRATALHRDAVGPRVTSIVDPVLSALEADEDPHCWVVWGDDPANRYTMLVPTAAGLVTVHVRVSSAGEGPRASAKVTRWGKLQVGELAVETQANHRLISFQVEQQILQAGDETGDAIARFALVLFAAMDGRPWPSFDAPTEATIRPTAGRGTGD